VDVLSYTPGADELSWTFGGVAPVRRVTPGTVLELWTEDAFAGKVRTTDDLVSRVIDFPFVNPLTGPFHVEGAEPGDTLAVHFVSIEPSRDWAASSTIPLFGALTTTHVTAGLQEPLEELVWLYDVDTVGRTVTFRARRTDDEVELPLDPCTAPSASLPPASRPARRSCPTHMAATWTPPRCGPASPASSASTSRAPLFALGDGHCRQGEGETCGVAVEAAMDTTVIVDVIKGVPTPWPRLESRRPPDEHRLGRPLEDAVPHRAARPGHLDREECGLDPLDSYQLVTQACESPIANVCDPNYTVVAKIRKQYLPRLDAYAGAHARPEGDELGLPGPATVRRRCRRARRPTSRRRPGSALGTSASHEQQ
jgi:acetamidase/formamidase